MNFQNLQEFVVFEKYLLRYLHLKLEILEIHHFSLYILASVCKGKSDGFSKFPASSEDISANIFQKQQILGDSESSRKSVSIEPRNIVVAPGGLDQLIF